MTLRAALALLLCVIALRPAAAAPAHFSLESMARLASVSDAVITPDDTRIAYVVSRNVMGENTTHDELHIYERATKRDRALPFAHTSYDNLTWSPDGKQLAYIAYDDATKADQLFVTTLDGTGERRLTSASGSVLEAAWRPDGGAFAVVRRESVPEKTGAARFQDAFEVTDNEYLATHAAVPAHLWVTDAQGGERRLTSGNWSVADTRPSWSPDGRSIAYEHAPSAVHGIQDRAFIEVVNVATLARRALTGARAGEDDASYAPDGARVAYVATRNHDPANADELYVAPSAGGAGRDVSNPLNRHLESYAWELSGTVLLRVYDRTRARLAAWRPGGSFHYLPLGSVADVSLSTSDVAARDGSVVFVGASAARPPEVYCLTPGAREPERLTDVNAEIASLQLGAVKEISWHNGAFTEYGVLTYPPDYDPHRTYPLVLRVHGGPTETSMAAFDSFYQLAAAHGYIVFAPNYRGSSDDGNAFERAIYNDASIGPGTDVIAGIRAVERTGTVDPHRIAVSGWSYGGQLTTWLIGHYHIWKAAVTGAGVNDLVVDYAIADDIDADRHAFPGSPYLSDNMELWRKQSPITYVTQIRTPTLILCNVYDVRVPIVESYELYRALRDRGVPVRFFAYPATGHLPHGPVRLADAYRRWLDWFDTYLHPSS